MTSDQLELELELEPPAPNPNAWIFDEDGKPRRLMWCSDSARLGGPCPYLEPRPSMAEPGTFLPPLGADRMPPGGCCKDITAGHSAARADIFVSDGEGSHRSG